MTAYRPPRIATALRLRAASLTAATILVVVIIAPFVLAAARIAA
jgi:hypothetical protein